MSILEELNTVLADMPAPIETGVFSDRAPDAYMVIVPLADTFDLHADNEPSYDIQEVRISIYTKGSYTALKNKVIRRLFTDFDEKLWFTLMDHITVYSSDDIRFTFKNGTEVKA